MINWTYSFSLFLCFFICISTEDPIAHPHRPDTEPDMDLKPAIRIPAPESTTVKSTRSYMSHNHDFSLPVPNTMNWPAHPIHEDYSDHSHHHEDYEYYDAITETTEMDTVTYSYESGDYETVIPENSKNDSGEDGGGKEFSKFYSVRLEYLYLSEYRHTHSKN